MSDQTSLALTQDPRTFQVVGLPTLDRVKNERVGELAKKLGRSSTEILVFGQAAQTAISGSADGMLQHVRMRSTGYAGELLRQLEEQMQSLDPSMLREVRGLLKSLPLVGRLFGSLDQRIRTFLQRFDAVEGVLNGIKVRLEEERIAAFQGIQQMETLRNDADRYKDALQICIAAAALKLAEFQEEYRQKQSALQGSVDSGELGNLQGLWDLMELLHQRVYSLQMALSLAENTTHESRQVEKVLTFSANALQEAATLGLTAWKQKLTVAINLLRAEPTRGRSAVPAADRPVGARQHQDARRYDHQDRRNAAARLRGGRCHRPGERLAGQDHRHRKAERRGGAAGSRGHAGARPGEPEAVGGVAARRSARARPDSLLRPPPDRSCRPGSGFGQIVRTVAYYYPGKKVSHPCTY